MVAQMSNASLQDKTKEVEFFDSLAVGSGYDVFTPASSLRLINACIGHLRLDRGARVADLGCGSGVFSDLLQRAGFSCVGLDLSPKLIAAGRSKFPKVEFLEGDVEHLPFPDASFDGILLSGIVHHLPDPSRCASEIYRVLRPRGRFVAFDPNRRNPFMWLYRDRSSPFYSSVGVTENERPVIAAQVAETFRAAGFKVGTDYLSNLRYNYIASGKLRWLLPAYNAIDAALFALPFLKPFRAFVLVFGEKS